MPYTLVPNQGSTPANAVVLGHQNDAGDMILGVARTPHGDIPGKVKDNTCWYPYGGEECITNDFQYVVAPHYALTLKPNTGSGPPPGAIPIGQQHDGSGTYCAAVAHTPHGRIPGKAQGQNCWYAYGGQEVLVHQFDWVVETNY